ncbi:hypothetical protein FQA47_023427 [Oryzias melastigma]|uniref:Uncharacterized protein n=1 Tax=Oryzias melastigma TaxID=30732 RepID=A0A834C325_ORYME|nr:hypothetical protein FQA47_023427 [Oryzias melastigma]
MCVLIDGGQSEGESFLLLCGSSSRPDSSSSSSRGLHSLLQNRSEKPPVASNVAARALTHLGFRVRLYPERMCVPNESSAVDVAPKLDPG